MSDNNFKDPITRRRALSIVAGAGALLFPGRGRSERQRHRYEWQGTAMGADARIVLYHWDPAVADVAVRTSVAEIERLENEFSLFKPYSALSRLNRDCLLESPSLDMVRLMTLCKRFGDLSRGAFDITVQPLWRLFADHFNDHPNALNGPRGKAVEAALARVDYRRIGLSTQRITLGQGQEVSLNGIAQGYVTDRVANLLRGRGWTHVLINLGEMRALDARPDGDPWRVSLPEAGLTVPLMGGALATSEGGATRFEPSGRHHHLFDPFKGVSANRYRSVTAAAADATTADAMSTALFAVSRRRASKLIQRVGNIEAWLTDADGRTKHLKG